MEAGEAANGQWIRETLAQFEGRLVVYAARLLGDAERARDVVQDTFLRLCQQDRAAIEPHLAEWLYTVCRNRALDVRRKEGRMITLSEDLAQAQPSSSPSPIEILDRRECEANALAALARLDEKHQEVLRLKFQHGFSYRQISQVTGHSIGYVGYLIHEGIKEIRQELAGHDSFSNPVSQEIQT